jgi:hypothetical protein
MVLCIVVGIFAITAPGCGVQVGRYTCQRSGYDLLKPDFGIISMDRGNPFGHSGTPYNLLCVVMLCPGLKPKPPGDSSRSDGMIISTRYFKWSTNAGNIVFTYYWNRLSDKVTIAGSTFSRLEGNSFLARRTGDGEWSVQQLKAVAGDATSAEALVQLQRQLPDNKLLLSFSVLDASE